ncbi:hypothetical protein D3C87_1572970 [compost metagenome]
MPRTAAEANGVVEPLGRHVDAIVVRRQPDIDERIFFLKIRKPGQQPANGEGADGADHQDLAKMTALEAFQHIGHAIEGILKHRQQRLALGGDHQAARQALEQRHIEPALQQLDLVADGGLRHAQLDRCTGEAQMSRGCLEGPQCIEWKIRPDHGCPNSANGCCK